MATGARLCKFATPMFEPEAFQKQMYCIEENTCDIVGAFWCPRSHSVSPTVIQHPQNDSAPKEWLPFAPLVTPLTVMINCYSCPLFSHLHVLKCRFYSIPSTELLVLKKAYQILHMISDKSSTMITVPPLQQLP